MREISAAFRTDGREPDAALDLIDWLFGGGYQPRAPDFDWRGVVASGTKLRKHWDALVRERSSGTARQHIGRAALPARDDYGEAI